MEVMFMHHCLNCGIQLIKNQKKYCSTKCQFILKNKEYIKNWKNGLENGMRGEDQISTTIRNYMLEKSNHKCSLCGWSEINQFTKKVPLEIEHIDGNYKNNKEENLVVLCPNCHSLTSTYKALNTGKGRRGRYNNEPLKEKEEPLKHFCIDCNSEITRYSNGRCNDCAQKQRRKTERPGPYTIATDIIDLGFSQTGKKYGVSDNTIRKWCKSYDMPIKREELIMWLEKNRQSI
jgi:hypothetical protein